MGLVETMLSWGTLAGGAGLLGSTIVQYSSKKEINWLPAVISTLSSTSLGIAIVAVLNSNSSIDRVHEWAAPLISVSLAGMFILGLVTLNSIQFSDSQGEDE